VFGSLADAAIRLAYNNPSAYNPQNVSNALWAFAKAGRSHPQLYAALGPVGARIARNFSMQALANVRLAVSLKQASSCGRVDGVGADEASLRPRSCLETRSRPCRHKLGQEAVGSPSTPSTR